MKLKAELAVAVAAQVNTSLMTQVWLVKEGILDESDLPNSVFMGHLVQAKTPHFEFTALPDRIQFVATDSMAGGVDCGKIAFEKCRAIVKLLPHTPFIGLGINFVWHIDTSNPAKQGRAIFSVGDNFLGKWFSAEDSRFGGYASCNFEGDLRLKLTISPLKAQPLEQLQASFNYHADVASADDLLRSLDLWSHAREHSESVAKDLNERVLKCLG